jgi:hypothetical protein
VPGPGTVVVADAGTVVVPSLLKSPADELAGGGLPGTAVNLHHLPFSASFPFSAGTPAPTGTCPGGKADDVPIEPVVVTLVVADDVADGPAVVADGARVVADAAGGTVTGAARKVVVAEAGSVLAEEAGSVLTAEAGSVLADPVNAVEADPGSVVVAAGPLVP